MCRVSESRAPHRMSVCTHRLPSSALHRKVFHKMLHTGKTIKIMKSISIYGHTDLPSMCGNETTPLCVFPAALRAAVALAAVVSSSSTPVSLSWKFNVENHKKSHHRFLMHAAVELASERDNSSVDEEKLCAVVHMCGNRIKIKNQEVE